MKNSVSKNTANKKQVLGQYNTPEETVIRLFENIKDIDYSEYIFVEPSFGSGNIIKHVLNHCNFKGIYGCEIDNNYNEVIKTVTHKNIKLEIKNFYDVKFDNLNTPIFYFGNPPYRTPNISSKTHPNVIKNLKTKYSIGSIKEEAVFFILHTIDISPKDSHVFYILPKTIFQNPTKPFLSFKNLFKKNVTLKSIIDIENFFDNVDQDLVLCHFICTKPEKENYEILYNCDKITINEFWKDDVYSYAQIFKKTYLGSVPAESIFLSCANETVDEFKNRLERIFNLDTLVNEDNLLSLLSYNGEPHLTELKKKNKDKIKTVASYINEVKNNNEQDLSIFNDNLNYKKIKHRKENRFYFRHESLKKYSFVYLINPNPCESFYFTGNPTKISTDYFGFTDYDINRNSSPGAVRTVPLEDVEKNITDEFKEFWNSKTDRPISDIFEYLINVSNSEWWLERKKRLNKQYFSVPKNFLLCDF